MPLAHLLKRPVRKKGRELHMSGGGDKPRGKDLGAESFADHIESPFSLLPQKSRAWGFYAPTETLSSGSVGGHCQKSLAEVDGVRGRDTGNVQGKVIDCPTRN